MFRCTECQAEYDKKPDYCDCGNDIFEEIVIQDNNPEKPSQAVLTTKNSIQPEETIDVTPKPIKKEKTFFDIPSTIIFSICIILSFIIIFFIGKSYSFRC